MGDMQHPNPANPNHPSHDSTLIAGLAAGDLTDSERARATALVDACTPCAELHRDLLAIAVATRTLPNLATAPRDFRLNAEQAARLRRGSWIRAALRPFGSSRSATRPIAAAFTSLGIAGVFVVTILPGLLGGATMSPGAERDNAAVGAPSSTFEPAAVPNGPVTGLGSDASGAPAYGAASVRPVAVDPRDTKVDPIATDGAEGVYAGGNRSNDPDVEEQSTGGRVVTTPSPPNPILVGSLALLAIGTLLFGLRFAARRMT